VRLTAFYFFLDWKFEMDFEEYYQELAAFTSAPVNLSWLVTAMLGLAIAYHVIFPQTINNILRIVTGSVSART
jgi:hypothetical protein